MREIKPFLKWAGGKRQLLPEIEKRLPDFIKNGEKFNYVEPFIGSGSVMFHLINNYNENIERIIINDLNKRLIYLYETIIYNPQKFIQGIKKIEREYKKLDNHEKKDFYLKKREEFNNLPIRKDQKLNISMLFLFLNKTGFNGMYRENKSGDYNVPFGKQNNPSFLDEKNILNISKLLSKKIEIRNKSYENILYTNTNFKTFYYLDPPYIPVNKTSNFTEYIKGSNFHNPSSLKRLDKYCQKIKSLNGYLMMSNADTNETTSLLSGGGDISKVKARRSINSIGSKRGKVGELIIVNY